MAFWTIDVTGGFRIGLNGTASQNTKTIRVFYLTHLDHAILLS